MNKLAMLLSGGVGLLKKVGGLLGVGLDKTDDLIKNHPKATVGTSIFGVASGWVGIDPSALVTVANLLIKMATAIEAAKSVM